MTRKKFIKKLRSYRLSRNEIKPLVDYVVESKGKVSYNEIMEEIQLSIMKSLIKDICKEMTIDFDASLPVEYVSDEDPRIALTGSVEYMNYSIEEMAKFIDDYFDKVFSYVE